MKIDIAMRNLEKLKAHPDGIFTVSKKEKLVHISYWNFIGRFVKWIHNRHGEITAKVGNVIRESQAACRTVKKEPIKAAPLLDPLYFRPNSRGSISRTISFSAPVITSRDLSELIQLLEYLLRNKIISPKEYDHKLLRKDFSELSKLRKLKNDHLENKKLNRPDNTAARVQKSDSFLINYIDAYLAPYFQGKITEKNEDKNRPPLIQNLYTEYAGSNLSKDAIEAFALDVYIKASSRHFRQMMAASEGELSPTKVMLPALQSAIAIDFKGINMDPDNVQDKINAAVSKMNGARIEILTHKQVNQFINNSKIDFLDSKEPLMPLLLKKFKNDSKLAQELLQTAALERYLELYKEDVKDLVVQKGINPDNVHGEVHTALAKRLPVLKRELEKNFPGLSRGIIDAKAREAMKEIASYIIYDIRPTVE